MAVLLVPAGETGVSASGDDVDQRGGRGAGEEAAEVKAAVGAGEDGGQEQRRGRAAVAGGADRVELDSRAGDWLLAAVDGAMHVDGGDGPGGLQGRCGNQERGDTKTWQGPSLGRDTDSGAWREL